MSGLSSFYKQNAKQVENIKYVASQRFVDEEGTPIEWEIKTINGREDENLRKRCTKRVSSSRRKGVTTEVTDTDLYAGRLAVECTVFPNLKDAELQNSYGVVGADELLKVMLTPGEYVDYLGKVQEINGFDQSMEDLGEEIKN